MPSRPADHDPSNQLSRRTLFGAAGALAAGGAASGASAAYALRSGSPTAATPAVVPFRGPHQAGILTEAQDRMHFCVFDVTTESTAELVGLLKTWTAVAERFTQGHESVDDGAVGGNPYAPPADTGEALGLPASQLTLTIGFGPSLFARDGRGRFGIAGRQPPALLDLPKFRNETMDPARCGGDICIQACANDPQVAVHAIRNLARVAFGTATVRYSQLGFGRTSATTRAQATPRNLFGFKDGTANLRAEDTTAADLHVWVGSGDGPAWLTGGMYLVTRRIRMRIEAWDRTTLREQERVIGRRKGSGAPVGHDDEFTPLDLAGTSGDGEPLIDARAHVRLAAPEHLGGIRILRRGYNFTDGSDGMGHLDAGLFFIAFVRNPMTQFVPLQTELANRDALNEYITHTGTGVFACPPGITAGDDAGYWGAALVES